MIKKAMNQDLNSYFGGNFIPKCLPEFCLFLPVQGARRLIPLVEKAACVIYNAVAGQQQ